MNVNMCENFVAFGDGKRHKSSRSEHHDVHCNVSDIIDVFNRSQKIHQNSDNDGGRLARQRQQ